MAGTTAWILGDQLSRDHPALDGADRVLMIESSARATRRRHHRHKLVLLFSAMRHRAEELADDIEVDYRESSSTLDAIRDHVDVHHPDRIVMAGASEYRGRRLQESLADRLDLDVEILANTQMLVERHDPLPGEGDPGKRVVMERFYREMRRHHGLLMDGGEPLGGRWNLDEDNRRPYPKHEGLDPPAVPSFEPDSITRRVMEKVAGLEGHGTVDGFDSASPGQTPHPRSDPSCRIASSDSGPTRTPWPQSTTTSITPCSLLS